MTTRQGLAAVQRDLREAWRELRAAEQRWRTDDAPWWAEVLSIVLAVGLTIRSSIHVMTVLSLNAHVSEKIDPHLADTDISLKSPVQGLRGHHFEVTARCLTLIAGIGFWALLTPLESRAPVARPVIVLQTLVLVSDPLAYLLDRLRHRIRTKSKQASQS